MDAVGADEQVGVGVLPSSDKAVTWPPRLVTPVSRLPYASGMPCPVASARKIVDSNARVIVCRQGVVTAEGNVGDFGSGRVEHAELTGRGRLVEDGLEDVDGLEGVLAVGGDGEEGAASSLASAGYVS
ncbi:MAG TPA: hypothetical protein VFB06_04255 [Streptosporangiaceae bacterium]|nr:hypothetical protein [Streptosporangiaceae bacterium]